MIEIQEICTIVVPVNQVDVYNTWRSTGTTFLEYDKGLHHHIREGEAVDGIRTRCLDQLQVGYQFTVSPGYDKELDVVTE